MKWTVEIIPSALAEIEKLPADIRFKVSSKIASLEENPFPSGGMKKLKGHKVLYRARVGDTASCTPSTRNRNWCWFCGCATAKTSTTICPKWSSRSHRRPRSHQAAENDGLRRIGRYRRPENKVARTDQAHTLLRLLPGSDRRVAGRYLNYGAVRAAIELSSTAVLSFWDALIVVAASHCGAKRLYTEDLHDRQVILGVEIVNPFRAARGRE